MKYFDQHVHSTFSYDGKDSVLTYINRAKELGYDTLVFTEHYDTDPAHYEKWRTDFKKVDKELTLLRKKYPEIKILKGVEIGFSPDKVFEIIDLVKNNNFDLINFSIHEAENIDFYSINEFKQRGVDEIMAIYFNAIIDMINTFNDYDVLSHIDYAFKTIKIDNPNASITKYEEYLISIMSILIKNNKGLEINCKVQSGINDDNHIRYLLNLYKSLGGKYITLSSDAHRAINLGIAFNPRYLRIIKECGFDDLTFFIDHQPVLAPIDDLINFKLS